MNNGSENFNFLDMLTIFSLMLQMQNYQNHLRSVTNDDLMAELQKQDTAYFRRILENQNKIISILSDIESNMSAE